MSLISFISIEIFFVFDIIKICPLLKHVHKGLKFFITPVASFLHLGNNMQQYDQYFLYNLYISDPIIGGLIKSTEKVSNELDILESHEIQLF